MLDRDEAEYREARRCLRGRPTSAALARERIVAAGFAVLLNAWAGALLLRAPTPLHREVADRPLEVVWVEQTPVIPRAAAVPAVRESTIQDVGLAAAPAAAAKSIAGPQGEPMLAETAKPTTHAATSEGMFARPPGDPVRAEGARRGVFGRRPVDPFTRRDDGPFPMRDMSLGGRLQRMARRADCAELRSRLRGHGENQEAILRAMSERRCT